jgi:hypothetical protein
MIPVVDGTSPGSRQMAGFDINGVKHSNYVSRILEFKVV